MELKQVLRQRDVMEVTGYSRTWIYYARKRGEFPAPTHTFGRHSMGWDRSDIEAFMESKRVATA